MFNYFLSVLLGGYHLARLALSVLFSYSFAVIWLNYSQDQEKRSLLTFKKSLLSTGTEILSLFLTWHQF